MPRLPDPDAVARGIPQGQRGIVSTRVQAGNMGDGIGANVSRPITDDSMLKAGIKLYDIGLQMKQRTDQLNLQKAKSALAVGLTNAEKNAYSSPYTQRMEAFSKESDKAFQQAMEMLTDEEHKVNFQTYAEPHLASYGAKVHIGVIKDERDAHIAVHEEGVQQAMSELAKLPAGDIAAQTAIIERTNESISNLVNTGAISAEQGAKEKVAVAQTYAVVQYGKLDAKEQLAAVARAREKGYVGWENHLPPTKLDALADAAKAELEVETTLGNAQAAFDELTAGGGSLRQKRARMKEMGLSPKERQMTARLLDQQQTRDEAARREYRDAKSSGMLKRVLLGESVTDLMSENPRAFVDMDPKDMSQLMALDDARIRRATRDATAKDEAREKAQKAERAKEYDLLLTRMANEDTAWVADLSMVDIAARFPEDEATQKRIQNWVLESREALKTGTKPTKALAANETTRKNMLDVAFKQLGIKNDVDQAEFRVEFDLARERFIEGKTQGKDGTSYTVTPSDEREIIKELSRVHVRTEPGVLWDSTENVPQYKLRWENAPAEERVRLIEEVWPKILEERGLPVREPSEREKQQLYIKYGKTWKE